MSYIVGWTKRGGSLQPAKECLTPEEGGGSASMHESTLVRIVVDDSLMLYGAIIPNQHITLTPTVAVNKFGLDDVLGEGAN